MESEKAPAKSHESTSSDPPAKELAKPSKPRATKKGKQPKKKKKSAEIADDEHPDLEESAAEPSPTHDNYTADFGYGGEWPLDPKHDSAGAPIRAVVPAAAKVEKKESRKRTKQKKKSKEQLKESKEEIKDQPEAGGNKKEPPSSDNKVSEKAVTEECTTKRNLHLIKTERAAKNSDEEFVTADDSDKEEEKRKQRLSKNRKKKSKDPAKPTKMSREEARRAESLKQLAPGANKKKRGPELGSLKVEAPPGRISPSGRVVERGSIKAEGFQDVERHALEDFMPQLHYDNLPETAEMRALKQEQRDPNVNPFTPRSRGRASGSAPCSERGLKKLTPTDRPISQLSSGIGECTELAIDKPFSLKQFFRHPPAYIWGVVLTLFVLCLGLTILAAVMNANNSALEAEIEGLKRNRPRGPK